MPSRSARRPPSGVAAAARTASHSNILRQAERAPPRAPSWSPHGGRATRRDVRGTDVQRGVPRPPAATSCSSRRLGSDAPSATSTPRFSTPENTFDVNLGLRDQIAALEWVQGTSRLRRGPVERDTVRRVGGSGRRRHPDVARRRRGACSPARSRAEPAARNITQRHRTGRAVGAGFLDMAGVFTGGRGPLPDDGVARSTRPDRRDAPRARRRRGSRCPPVRASRRGAVLPDHPSTRRGGCRTPVPPDHRYQRPGGAHLSADARHPADRPHPGSRRCSRAPTRRSRRA